ncbi:ATP-binding protein [Methylomonas sp. MgM2]
MKLRSASIKTKLTASLLAIVVLAFAPYEYWNYWQTKRRLTAELEVQADRKILRLSDNLEIPLWEMDQSWIRNMIRIEMLDENAYAIQVFGEEQLSLSEIRNVHGQVIDGKGLLIDGEFVKRGREVTHEQVKIGDVTLYLSKRNLSRELHREAIAAGIRTLTLIVLIVLILEVSLNRLVIKPLFELLDVVKAIARGHYDVEFDEGRGDELGILSRGIAKMLQNLRLRETERDRANEALQAANRRLELELVERSKAQAALRELNETLEQRIKTRTADLERSNCRLQEMGIVLEKAKNSAEAANSAKSIFLANMTHELRTPMNAVLGFSRLMQSDKTLTEEQREVLDIINRSGNHLLSLINQVLDMAKIESGRMVVENAPFDLGATIRDVIDMMRERAASKGLDLYIDQGSSFPRVINADAVKFKHILINLLGNAIKYTLKGQVILRLHTQSKSADDPLVLICEVEDTGVGIANEDLSRIFDAFVQVGKIAEQHGTGLGLVITKQYVELMGGHITVDSEPGKGSLFRVFLPAARVDESELEIGPEPNVLNVIGLEPGQPSYRILIAEDQPDSRLLLKRLLGAVGFSVFEASNGFEAIEGFKRNRPDFIWMDSRMPIIDGITATKTILAMPEAEGLKIAAVTASTNQDQRKALLDAGVCAIVYKPYRDEEIFECMARHLGVRYVYEEGSAPHANGNGMNRSELAERLKGASREWLDNLRDAAIELDVERCLDIAKQIQPEDALLAASLKELVNQFNFAKIIDLIPSGQPKTN